MGFIERIQEERDKLQSRRDQLVKEITNLDAELKELDTALRVAKKLEITGNTAVGITPSAKMTFAVNEPPNMVYSGTNKDLIRKILHDEFPNGLQASDIRHKATTTYGRDINPNTLTVTLSRIKAAGEARIDRRTWFYTPCGEPMGFLDHENQGTSTEDSEEVP